MAKKTTRPDMYWDDEREKWTCDVKIDGKYKHLRADSQRALRDQTLAEAERAAVERAQHRTSKTVAEFAETWRGPRCAGLSYSWANSINNALDNHILPILGGMELSAVTPADIDIVIASTAGKSMSLSRQIMLVLRIARLPRGIELRLCRLGETRMPSYSACHPVNW